MIPRARRFEAVRGFGIDRVAAAADRPAQANPDWPVLRMENLDTDLPLPPEAVRETVAGLEQPESNSWLPFTGDHDLRAAIADFTAERTGHRYDPETEIVITVGGMEGLLNALLATVSDGDESSSPIRPMRESSTGSTSPAGRRCSHRSVWSKASGGSTAMRSRRPHRARLGCSS